MNIIEMIDANQKALNAIRPFEGGTLKQIREYYRVGLTFSSNALEGNSLTEIETKILLEDGMTVGGKPLRDTFEALGHAKSYDYMFSLLGERRITLEDIKTLHRLFYMSIDEAQAGVWRETSVIVTGSDYVFPAPDELIRLMANLERWIESERESMHPVHFAAMLHMKFVTIHPFVDGNGRVARLLMNTALIQDGYMLAVVPPLLRTGYLTAIRIYQQKGTVGQFCDFIAEQVLQSQKDMIRLLHIKI